MEWDEKDKELGRCDGKAIRPDDHADNNWQETCSQAQPIQAISILEYRRPEHRSREE